MSALFSSIRIGQVELENRFMRSATYEGMAGEGGQASDAMVRLYRTLGKGGIGLIIPGYMYVHQHGRAYRQQTGIHDDALIPGLQRLARAAQEQGSKVSFQLVHAGWQTTRSTIGRTPLAPSATGRDPVNFIRPHAMTEEEIEQVIQAFAEAAVRAAESGADGIQLHAAHGYLLNQFLSPFFNRRDDSWGGSPENRFRLLREIFNAVRKALPESMFVMVKLNTDDHTPRQGITPEVAVQYARWLAELGIDGLEISSGTMLFSFMNTCRGDVPAEELVRSLPWWKKPVGALMMRRLAGRYGFDEPYHLSAAKAIRSVLGDVPLALVGGVRRVATMERLVSEDVADLISLCRPLIREPFLVRRIRDGAAEAAACESCNRCMAAVANHLLVRCYVRGLPG
jgi:2,4-dienoyl-CoA reductase-like NADH-dependent reductase (Old Yellow Enzyme family)